MKIRKVVLKILDPDMYKIFKLFERFFKSSLTYSNHWGQRTKYINVIKLIYTVNSEGHKFFGNFFWGRGGGWGV